MSRPFARIDLSSGSPDFQPVALELGVPMLDRTGANTAILRAWLGRFVAEPQWDGECVNFFVYDDAQGRPTEVVCRPVTANRLRTTLRAELSELEERIFKIRPNSQAEEILCRAVKERFHNLTTGSERISAGCHFFEYRDPAGKRRLVWCWGHQQAHPQPTPPVVCANRQCNRLFLPPKGKPQRCPGCGRVPMRQRVPWARIAAAVLLLALVVGAGVYWWSTRPTAMLVGQVVALEDNKRPVADAEVLVEGTSRSTRTNDNGRFRLERLPAGPIKLRVVAARYDSKTEVVELTRGEEAWKVVHLSGGTFPMGQVVCAVSGNPVAEAKVRLEGSGHGTVLTGPEGNFRFPGLVARSADIKVQAAGFRDAAAQWTNESEALVIELTGSAVLEGRVVSDAYGQQRPVPDATIRLPDTGQSVRSDQQGLFRLEGVRGVRTNIEALATGFAQKRLPVEPAPEEVTSVEVRLTGGGSLTGRVLDAAAGKPLAGVTVSVQGTELKARTDAQGQYSLAAIPPGPVKVQAIADGFNPGQKEFVAAEGKNPPVDFSLVGGSGFTGVVVWQGGGESTPIAGANVAIKGTDLATRTGSDGRFSLAGLSPQPVTVQVTATGFLPAEVQRNPATDRGRPIPLAGDTSLSGRVTDATYDPPRPLSGATVRVANSPLAARTDAQGRFSIQGARSGAARIAAEANGYAAGEVSKNLVAEKDNAVGDVLLAGSAELAGSILNEASKRPIPNAALRIADTALRTRADAQGRYRLAGVPAGREVRVEAAAAGFFRRQVTEKFDPGANRLDMPLSPPADLAVKVVDARTRQPIANAAVRIADSTHSGTTDAAGEVQFAQARAGLVRVSADAQGYCEKRVSQEVQTAKASILVPLEPGIAFVGEVVNAINNRPVAGAEVVVVDVNGIERTVQTNAAGRYRVEGVAAGAATVTVSSDEFSADTVRQVLSAQTVLRNVLNPKLDPGEIRLVLTWAKDPRDLDAHLFGPRQGGGKFHVYYDNRVDNPSAECVRLDVDNKRGQGPETITIKKPVAGRYSFWVEDSSNASNPASPVLATRSAAEVKIYHGTPDGTRELKRFAARASGERPTGPAWHSFDLDVQADGGVQVAPVDKYGSKLP